MPPLTYLDIVLRLGAATGVGALLGLDRELRRKPAGVRTMALVALGSAMFVLMMLSRAAPGDPSDISRVVQGIITGVGFLGAGTILRGDAESGVRGLTTAASIWLAAAARRRQRAGTLADRPRGRDLRRLDSRGRTGRSAAAPLVRRLVRHPRNLAFASTFPDISRVELTP